MSNFQQILDELESLASDNYDKGNRFERLMVKFFRTDLEFKTRFSDVWLWNAWPKRNGRPDTGIDIVAKERDRDGYCAVQCKFYAPTHTVSKGDIDSFLSASGTVEFSSRLFVSTTDKWGANANAALEAQHIPVGLLRFQDLANSSIDWSKFSIEHPENMVIRPKKLLRPHQKRALDDVTRGFETADRGKLIMACGTGKTFTSLKIAEAMLPEGGTVLFLVPSISLLSQSLKEWVAESQDLMHCYAICSDTTVGKNKSYVKNEDLRVTDLDYPATTDTTKLISHFKVTKGQVTVVFSTYQSIKVVAQAHQHGLPEFDLAICDEAHRTTGVTQDGDEDSAFVLVHDANLLKAKKRLYMTATPRIYVESAKVKASETDAAVYSMDDVAIYGKEFHRLGFGEAVGLDLLTDYKVIILAVSERAVQRDLSHRILSSNDELSLPDAVKIIGCWNALSGQAQDPDAYGETRPPLKRAVAFSSSINNSKIITKLFPQVVEEDFDESDDTSNKIECEVHHVDGTYNVLTRNAELDWLKADTDDTCRILSNARCLSEGVDVPSLDAVLFLDPRDSQVDIVQSVGRVMRKSEGKDYGYIILPIGIPEDQRPEDALDNNKAYGAVWKILQALRAHDDRFQAEMNKIDLNKTMPRNIQIIGVGTGLTDDDGNIVYEGSEEQVKRIAAGLFDIPIDEWRDAIYAKLVQKVGDRKYWETWARDIATIANNHISGIKFLIDSTPEHRIAFDTFLEGLRENLNPSINEDSAIEMLAQHMITKPVFDSLFEGYEFTTNNPVSISMQSVLDQLEDKGLEKETASLEKFYESVRARAAGVDNLAGKQRIVIELYDKFFKNAFPRMVESLGIVYTPIEVVDFIIHSADFALREEFGVGLSDRGVHVLDPFTGTGTFLVRLLQSGLIRTEDLAYKYTKELHANEIVLLAYYIAAINIEETFHFLNGGSYQPFEGIVLTDTFQMSEGANTLDEIIFPDNNKRATKQKQTDIRVIVGNPPYSAGQESANDNNQNLKYAQLDKSIELSYVASSNGVLKKNLYDSYIRAFRWASERIKDKGVICFVSNASFIDGNAMDGLRKTWAEEFSSIYVFNLRGNALISGVQRQKEKGNIFGEGSRTPIAITLLVKNPAKTNSCEIHYRDIGDYLSQKQKLSLIAEAKSIKGLEFDTITPNAAYDWINQRSEEFETFVPLGDNKDRSQDKKVVFSIYSLGVATNRDAWAYNFSRDALAGNMARMIDFYNTEVERYKTAGSPKNVGTFVDADPTKISWTVNLKDGLTKGKKYSYEADSERISMYRPFAKQNMYFNRRFNERVLQIPKLFPTADSVNLVITMSGVGASKDFSALITDTIPNLHTHDTGQCFPLYYYEEATDDGLFDSENNRLQRKDAITDWSLGHFHASYNDRGITKEDIFYYIYGVLHSPTYRETFASDLKKMLPRIPILKGFWEFSKAGRDLAYLHINYERIEPYPLEDTSQSLEVTRENFKVIKMTFASKADKSMIVYNSKIKLSGIPEQAYDYQVNGKSAIEWIMDRYQVKVEKDSRILNDPNAYSGDPRYIVDLIKRLVTVSVKTIEIVSNLPTFEIIN